MAGKKLSEGTGAAKAELNLDRCDKGGKLVYIRVHRYLFFARSLAQTPYPFS